MIFHTVSGEEVRRRVETDTETEVPDVTAAGQENEGTEIVLVHLVIIGTMIVITEVVIGIDQHPQTIGEFLL